MEKEIKAVLIKCPHCGWEYLPCEIFYPDDMLGNAADVVRDSEGKILYYDGDSMNLEETYCCDNCGTTFSVSGAVTFKTKVEEEVEDEEEWTVTEIE